MSKLLVVKQDAKAFNAYFADDSTQGYYRVSDCVPVDIDEATELVQSFSRELYDVWQEAKSPTEDNWDDVEYDILSVTHRREYEKTAKRMLAQVSKYLQERMNHDKI